MPEEFPAGKHYRIGIISDTHGRLPEAVQTIFRDVDLIIHAGDIGGSDVLEALEAIAPTVAVRGNMDRWSHTLPQKEVIRIGGLKIAVQHDIHHGRLNTDAGSYDAVISGHTHRPAVERRRGVLYVNPGSAARPGWGCSPSVARILINGGRMEAQLIELK